MKKNTYKIIFIFVIIMIAFLLRANVSYAMSSVDAADRVADFAVAVHNHGKALGLPGGKTGGKHAVGTKFNDPKSIFAYSQQSPRYVGPDYLSGRRTTTYSGSLYIGSDVFGQADNRLTMDCSSFIAWLFSYTVNEIPADYSTSGEWGDRMVRRGLMIDTGLKLTKSTASKLQKGDVLWKVGHILVYVGEAGGKHIQVEVTVNDMVCRALEEDYMNQGVYRIYRLNPDKEFTMKSLNDLLAGLSWPDGSTASAGGGLNPGNVYIPPDDIPTIAELNVPLYAPGIEHIGIVGRCI